jgi:Transposase, Mutator family
VSTGDFAPALAALLGKDPPGLSAATIARLKEVWIDEHKRWSERDLSAKSYVYLWADSVYLQARILVIIGATPEGKKELLGFVDGARESAHDWRALLLDLKRRGLSMAPKLAVADGALGFWKAIGEIWPKTCEQRCWVHKTANILNKLPKSQQPKAKRMLQDIWMAGNEDGRRGGVRRLCRNLCRQVRQGRGMPEEGSGSRCSPSTTSRPNIGNTCARRIRSKTPSRPSDTGRSDQRDASRTGPRSPWCSSWSKARKRPGVASTATTSCQRSVEV